MAVFAGTPVAPLIGVTPVTCGVKKSVVEPVVKFVTTGGLIACMPLRSVTPVTVIVQSLFGDSTAAGVSVNVWFPFPRLRVTFTGVAPAAKVTCPIV